MAIDLKDVQSAANSIGQNGVASTIGSIGSSAASGVALGSIVPGIGNVVGGIVGAIGGLFSSIFSGGPSLQEREATEAARVAKLSPENQAKYASNKEYVWAQQKAIDDSDREYNWAHRNDAGFVPVTGRKFADPNAGKDYIDILEGSNSSSAPSGGSSLDINQALNQVSGLTDVFAKLLSPAKQGGIANRSIASVEEMSISPDKQLAATNNFSQPSQLITSNLASGLIIGGALILGFYLYKKGVLK